MGLYSNPGSMRRFQTGFELPGPGALRGACPALGRRLHHRCQSQTKSDGYLTCPMVIETAEILTKVETVPTPFWSSFAGSVGGLWLGHRAVYAPFSGEPEPIAMDGKKKVYYLSQCCVEERKLSDEGVDCIVRHEARATQKTVLEEQMRDAGKLEFSRMRDDSNEWEVDTIEQDQDGLFIFDGGSYSRGPLALCEDYLLQDDDEEEEGYTPTEKVHVIENCLQWNGEERVRISVSFAAELIEPENGGPDPELDISLLRVAVNRETWEGVPGQYTSSSQSESDEKSKKDSGETRIPQDEMQGFWNVFEVHVSRVEDVDMKTGHLVTMPIYSSQEFQKVYQPGNMFEGPACALDGGTLWLPHRVVLQVSVPAASEDTGLEISMLWSPGKGKFLNMTRSYSTLGAFKECICSTGLKKS
eukprot:jgi/Picre1/31098/NNA_006453.t1